MPPTEATIRDIAAAANVSLMSVSRALRGKRGVGAATRARILKAAKDAGYRPDPLVSTLMAKRARRSHEKSIATLAFLVPTMSVFRDAFGYGVYRDGAVERSQTLGFNIDVIALDEVSKAPKGINRILRARGIEGLLITAAWGDPGLQEIRWEYFAVSMLGPIGVFPRVHRACTDHFQGMQLAIENLERLGYTRIGYYLHHELDAVTGRRWTAAYENYQLSLSADHRVEAFICQEKDPRTFAEWIRASTPQVIISDHLEAFHWLREMRAKTGFVHLDWIPSFRDVAGIDQCSKFVSAAAVDLIIEQLHRNERGLPEHPKAVLLEAQWVPGKSVREQRGRRAAGSDQ